MTNRVIKIFTVIMIVVLIVSCCGCRELVSGEVIEKTYEPSYMLMFPTKCGEVMVTNTIYIPESWKFIVIDDEGVKHSIAVTEEQYKKTKVGEIWNSVGE